ncbi:hypothetical protein AB0M54_05220 [Actinoplanes sp. NPDC051470]|uniref:hypothetical protein n=1 Tax=Actinoplanes sp. NPDC051470 TaxID=3157224 RepID=UPI00341BD0FB
MHTVGAADDTARVHHISTLVFWARAEEDADPAAPEAAELRREAARLTPGVEASDARRRMRNLPEGGDRRSFHPNGRVPELSDDDNPR